MNDTAYAAAFRRLGAELEHTRRVAAGSPLDVGKEPDDWMWLVGAVVGQAAGSVRSGNIEAAREQIIQAAAELLRWDRSLGAAALTLERDPNAAPNAKTRVLLRTATYEFCVTCRGITRGRCDCVMHQDGIDARACMAHKVGGHVGGGCRCAPSSEIPNETPSPPADAPPEVSTDEAEDCDHCYRHNHDYNHPCCDCGAPGLPVPPEICGTCRLQHENCECHDDPEPEPSAEASGAS